VGDLWIRLNTVLIWFYFLDVSRSRPEPVPDELLNQVGTLSKSIRITETQKRCPRITQMPACDGFLPFGHDVDVVFLGHLLSGTDSASAMEGPEASGVTSVWVPLK
jgi:hypothetical protein